MLLVGCGSPAAMPKGKGKPVAVSRPKNKINTKAPSATPKNPVALATAGATVYLAKCQICHGAKGAGGQGPPLNDGTVLKTYPTDAKLGSFISQSMPFNAPGTLTAAEVKQLVAYIDALNGKK